MSNTIEINGIEYIRKDVSTKTVTAVVTSTLKVTRARGGKITVSLDDEPEMRYILENELAVATYTFLRLKEVSILD